MSDPLLVFAKSFAEKLASDILTVWTGKERVECDRAQMIKKLSDGSEENMGGRSKASLVTLIEEHFLELIDKAMEVPSDE